MNSGKKLSKFSLFMRLAIVLGSIVVLLGCGGLFVFFSGQVRGTEFCPEDFSNRSFSYYELPFIKKQITGISRTVYSSNLSSQLTTDGILPTAPKPKTWHLVSDNRTAQNSPECDANILVTYLNHYDSEFNNVWVVWSTDNPDHAKFFWPIISDLAKNELYVDIPQLMEFARQPGSIDQFKTQIDAMVADIYFDRASDLQKLGDHIQAAAFFQNSLDSGYDPDIVQPLLEKSKAEIPPSDKTHDATEGATSTEADGPSQ